MKMLLTIKPKFFLQHASSKVDWKHDSTIVTDSCGIPYLRGTAIKGLLRESMEEVLEMQGKPANQVSLELNKFFGREGSSNDDALLSIPAARIPDHFEVKRSLDVAIQKSLISKSAITEYFCSTLNQTSLNEDDIAEGGSLRSIQVLNYFKLNTFECYVDSTRPMDEAELKLLRYTCANFCRMGMKRNRGLGKVKVTFDQSLPTKENHSAFSLPEGCTRVSYELYLKDPLVLPKQANDQNTIHTEKYISGSKISGALGYAFLEGGTPDADFYEIFLSGKVTFSDARIIGANRIPLSIQKKKYAPTEISDQLDNYEPGRLISGYWIGDKRMVPKTSLIFHNSRKNRSAGSSQEDDVDGSIFYYESLDAGQTFKGTISGSIKAIKNLFEKISYIDHVKIGASRSVNYGRCDISFSTLSSAIEEPHTKYILCQSPVILLDQQNQCTPTVSALENSLSVEIDNVISRNTTVRSYNLQWQGRTRAYTAIAPGSVFRLKETSAMPQAQFVGTWNHKGFGELRALSEVEYNDIKSFILDKEENHLSETSSSLADTILAEHKGKQDKYLDQSIKIKLQRITLNNSQIRKLVTQLQPRNRENWGSFLEHIDEKSLGVSLKAQKLFDLLKAHKDITTGEAMESIDTFCRKTITYLNYINLKN